ncbi:MAG: UDP-N-acetylglucosamine 1-carboxyvinyltransferase [Gammaproteobacteria bacterium]|jgi:UDP-N-acetylglucosamine 1-carboxyvinyltransferase|nr:UDP-N-acetylglucosamine 1-carboxyvinyltransferase [Gammaproteobacteria bacterium]
MAASTASSDLRGRTIPDKLVVTGGARLEGDVAIPGAKNAILPIMAACLLTDEPCHLTNVPLIEDVRIMAALLRGLGAEVDLDRKRHELSISASRITSFEADSKLVTEMRASFLVAGPLLVRFGRFDCVHPGGCAIGIRPVNVDIHGFRSMGATILIDDNCYNASAKKLTGTRIYLDYPSHTGTENLVMAACLAAGSTTIVHASREPEVLELVRFLRSMGAKISGEGTSVVKVDGSSGLRGTSFKIMPDRVAAGTLAIAGSICGGEVELTNVLPEMLEPVLYKLRAAGVHTSVTDRSLIVRSDGDLRGTEVQSMPYPGFPSDNQAAMGALLTQASGTSVIVERVFEDRFSYVESLRKLGADIMLKANRAIVNGPTRLKGTELSVENDLRAGSALILAGLVADGETTIHDARYIYRGFESLADDLTHLGAKVEASTFVESLVPA